MYPAKKGWKRITCGRLYSLYTEVLNHAVQIKIWPANREFPPLYTRNSAKTIGVCISKKRPDGKSDCAIVITEFVKECTDDQIRKVIVHEVAHALYPDEKHNSVWKRTANLIGKKWGYVAEIRISDSEIIERMRKQKVYKYEQYCPVCGAVWKYSRMCPAVRRPERFRCSKDNAKLKSRIIL